MSRSVEDVRPAMLAGKWYPGEASRLAATVDAFIAQADTPRVPGRLIGLLAPHAGHRYSGGVAGHAFRAAQGANVDVVAVIGPSHHPNEAAILTTGHRAFETPLGRVPVEHDAIARLCEQLPVEPVRLDAEHSLEIELPFLQRALRTPFQLIPIMLVDQSISVARALGRALAEILRERSALLVASSDLSHFYPQAAAQRLDRTLLDAVAAFEPDQVIGAEEAGVGFACGRGAIASVMIAARALGADTAEVVAYGTSGDITHDYERVVGYGAAVFYQAAAG